MGMSTKQALNRMNTGHARVLVNVRDRGAFVFEGLTLSDARGLAKCGATLRKWEAVQVTEIRQGIARAQLTAFGEDLLRAWDGRGL